MESCITAIMQISDGEKIVIYKTDFLNWCSSEDIEELGACEAFLSDESLFLTLEEGIDISDVLDFRLHYYARCILENPDGEWSDSSYSACWSLAGWLKDLYDKDKINSSTIKKIKTWIEGIYINGDDRIKNCILCGLIEHLFEIKFFQNHFADWKSDERFSELYVQGLNPQQS